MPTEDVLYLANDPTSASGLVAEIPEYVPYTEFTSNLIIEQITPFILHKLDKIMNEKFDELYRNMGWYFEQLSAQIAEISQERELEDSKVIIIEEMTKEQAKEKIVDFFDNYKEVIYPSEISEKLNISYELVWDILKELDEEDIIRTED